MFTPKEPLLSHAQETTFLSQESQRAHLAQEHGTVSREQATAHTVEEYARREAKDFLHETAVLPAHEAERLVLKLKPEAHDKQMEELFAIMLDKGIKNALDVVRGMQNPHLSDDFHRFLVQYLHTTGAIPGLKPTQELARELNHTLFRITLPASTDDNAQDFKRFIQAMKQFYMGMDAALAKDEHYTLELSVQNSGRDIAVFGSIPRAHIQTCEKLIHAYYPDAFIEEMHDDYNIFASQGGAFAGSVAKLAEPAIFPLTTDTGFEHDPLAALIGSLGQLAHEGEGGAIQFTIAKAEPRTNKFYSDLIQAAEKGDKKIKDLYKDATEGLLTSFGKGVLGLFAEEKKKDENAEKKIDTTGITLAQAKNQSHAISAGIRIITAANSLERAQSILATIKASFSQFSLVNSNTLSWSDRKGRDLPDFARDFSFRSQVSSQQLTLSINELATLFHFPVGLTGATDLKESTATTAPIPENMRAEGITLGTNSYRGTEQPVHFAKEDRVRHTYVIGQTGTGKTLFLMNMIIQDIKNGDGVCFIDPHGSDIEKILANIPPERIDDVIYFDPAYTARPMGLNLLEYDARFPEQKIFVINELLAIFNKLFDMKTAGGPAFEQYFRNSAGLIMEDPESGSTLLEISRVLSDKAFRDMKLSKCKNPIIKQFWENAEKTTGEASLANFVPYITNKFDPFVSNDIMRPVIAQQESVLNFREIMDKKKILLVNLSKGRLGDINAHLIGLLLVGKITMAALSRVDIVGKGEVNDFYLYIDEFQNVTTDSINVILSEARKYRLALTVAHQYIEQLDEGIKNAVFGNVGTMVVHRVSPENAEVFGKTFAPTFTPADIIKLENFNNYTKMLVGGTPAKPFNSKTPFPPKGNPEIAEKLKELSYLKYGRPREEVEAEIMARYMQ